MRPVKRIAFATILAALLVLTPPAVLSFQSPIDTPAAIASPLATPAPTSAARPTPAGPTLSPLIWIGVGLALGALLVILAQRTAPHDR